MSITGQVQVEGKELSDLVTDVLSKRLKDKKINFVEKNYLDQNFLLCVKKYAPCMPFICGESYDPRVVTIPSFARLYELAKKHSFKVRSVVCYQETCDKLWEEAAKIPFGIEIVED